MVSQRQHSASLRDRQCGSRKQKGRAEFKGMLLQRREGGRQARQPPTGGVRAGGKLFQKEKVPCLSSSAKGTK